MVMLAAVNCFAAEMSHRVSSGIVNSYMHGYLMAYKIKLIVATVVRYFLDYLNFICDGLNKNFKFHTHNKAHFYH